MKIGGIVDISTKDIPNRACMVIFTVGCNFSCEYCHNKYLLQPNVGRVYAIKDLIAKVMNNVIVKSISISGGEPTIQPEFVKSVLRECKKSGIHTALDTSGYVSYVVLKSILEWADLVLYDIKHVDPERHQSGTGLKNELILTNIAKVSKKVELK